MFASLWPARRRAIVIALVTLPAAALIAGACGDGGTEADDLAETSLRPDAQTDIVVPAGKPIVIGVSAPLTGPDAALGAEDAAAVVVAVDRWKAANGGQIKGHEIELRFEDDGCTEADIAVQAAVRLLRREGLVGVIGPSCSGGAAAAIPIYANAGIVAISGTATRTDLTLNQPEDRFFFRTAYRNDLQGSLVGLFAGTELQTKEAYLIDDGEPYGLDLVSAAQKAMEEVNVSVTRETVVRGAVDFSELASRIARDNPAFVGFAGFNPEASLLYRQLRDAGYEGLFGAGDAAASITSFVEPVGAGAAEGVLFSGCSLSLPEDFLTDFRKLHGGEPEASPFVAQGADAATILLDAVAEVAEEQTDGSLTIDPLALRDAVRATNLTGGVSGSVAFDDNGDRVPHSGDDLEQIVEDAAKTEDVDVFVNLGLVPCQVQDGELVNLLGPGAGDVR